MKLNLALLLTMTHKVGFPSKQAIFVGIKWPQLLVVRSLEKTNCILLMWETGRAQKIWAFLFFIFSG